jgi:hypothetical protein
MHLLTVAGRAALRERLSTMPRYALVALGFLLAWPALAGSTPGADPQCDASAPGALAAGMTAWIRETPFTPATLGAGLLYNTTGVCAALHPARTCAACAP